MAITRRRMKQFEIWGMILEAPWRPASFGSVKKQFKAIFWHIYVWSPFWRLCFFWHFFKMYFVYKQYVFVFKMHHLLHVLFYDCFKGFPPTLGLQGLQKGMFLMILHFYFFPIFSIFGIFSFLPFWAHWTKGTKGHCHFFISDERTSHVPF